MLLFFIPACKSLTPALKTQHGLDRLVESPQTRETMQGPAGSGLLVVDASVPPDRIHYAKQEQRWSPRFGLTSLVGTWNDTPPTPESLARDPQITGDLVKLLDGHQWQIPRLRQWRPGDAEGLVYSIQLPRVLVQSQETGGFVLGDVVPDYSQLWEHSLEIANAMFAQLSAAATVDLDDAVVFNFVVDLLSTNYRLDASVVSHLRLMTPELSGAVVRAGLDWGTLTDHLKKTLSRRISDATSTESGATPLTED